MISFTQIQQAQISIEDLIVGPDLKLKDKKRLGKGYSLVEHFMADEQWHSPQEILMALGGNRMDTALKMVRDMRKRGYRVDKESKGNGLNLYRSILLFR